MPYSTLNNKMKKPAAAAAALSKQLQNPIGKIVERGKIDTHNTLIHDHSV